MGGVAMRWRSFVGVACVSVALAAAGCDRGEGTGGEALGPSSGPRPTASSSPPPRASATRSPSPSAGATRHQDLPVLAWTPPVLVASDHVTGDNSLVQVAAGRDGALAAWEVVPRRGRFVLRIASSRGGRWGPAQTLSRRMSGGTQSLRMAVGRDDDAAVVLNERIRGGDLVVARQRLRGRWRGPHVLGPGSADGAVIGPDGVLTVVWSQPVPGGIGIRVASTDRAGRWRPTEELARHSSDASVSIGRHGDVAVVSPTGQGVSVAVRRAGACCWSTHTLHGAIEFAYPARVAVDGHGRVLAMWGHDIESGEGARRKHLAWAVSVSEEGGWSPVRYIDAGRSAWIEDIELAMNARGEAVAVWTGSRPRISGGPRPMARADRFLFRRGWGTARDLPLRGFPDAHISEAGTAAVVAGGSTWWQSPGEAAGGEWRRGGNLYRGGSVQGTAVAGSGSQLVAALYGAGVTARRLSLPSR